ncbi:MAG: hypothetical protein IJX63_03230 [Lachnospiraceae bacterium]|nr:hypothetical protein [Lachnospiraceae bacterium]
MNLAPIYELRSRLRASMIAGTNLLSEDFRLKRAVEEIAPMAALNPVFAKISQLANALIAEGGGNKEAVLMDTITLVDAVLCTQGVTAVAEEIEPIEVNGWGSVVTNAPYSVVKGLVEALTTSGNGHYQFVVDTHEEQPQLFSDYRVKSAMVEALGAGYAELAELVAKWLKQEGEEILPLLQKGFDPKGKKEMLRRLQVIQAIAGGKANDFYKRMIPDAEKDIRNELILALRHNQENVAYLQELIKAEKGKAKKMAYYALAEMEDTGAEKVFRDMYVKKPADVMSYLSMTTVAWASRLVAEGLMNQLERCKDPEHGKGDNLFTPEESELLRLSLVALIGKNGPEICQVYRKAFEIPEAYHYSAELKKGTEWKMRMPVRRADCGKIEYKRLDGSLAFFLDTSIRLNPTKDLCELALELYGNESMKNRNRLFFTAAFSAKLLGKEDCSTWLREQLYTKGLLGEKKRKDLGNELGFALNGIGYNAKSDSYYLQTQMENEISEVWEIFEQPITQDLSGSFTDVLIEYCHDCVDVRLVRFVNSNNEECCKKLEEYFYKRALTGPSDTLTVYWKGLQACGCERCEGLLTEYVSRFNGKNELGSWGLYSKMWNLPGTAENFEKEALAVLELFQSGKIKMRYWNEEGYRAQVETILAKRRKGY